MVAGVLGEESIVKWKHEGILGRMELLRMDCGSGVWMLNSLKLISTVFI